MGHDPIEVPTESNKSEQCWREFSLVRPGHTSQLILLYVGTVCVICGALALLFLVVAFFVVSSWSVLLALGAAISLLVLLCGRDCLRAVSHRQQETQDAFCIAHPTEARELGMMKKS